MAVIGPADFAVAGIAGFTNVSGAGAYLTIWGTTNLELPLNQWQNLGHPAESPAGTYQFNDPQATNMMDRFYRVTSP